MQRRVEESTLTHSVMIFQQLMKPPPDQSKFNFGRRHSLPEKVARFKVVVFTISQAPQPAPPRTTFVKPTIRVDDSLSRNVDWFSRLLFACVNGCVIIWLPGSVLTILAMNFTHPCIGGFTLDAFRLLSPLAAANALLHWFTTASALLHCPMHLQQASPRVPLTSLRCRCPFLHPQHAHYRRGQVRITMFASLFRAKSLLFAANSRIQFSASTSTRNLQRRTS